MVHEFIQIVDLMWCGWIKNASRMSGIPQGCVLNAPKVLCLLHPKNNMISPHSSLGPIGSPPILLAACWVCERDLLWLVSLLNDIHSRVWSHSIMSVILEENWWCMTIPPKFWWRRIPGELWDATATSFSKTFHIAPANNPMGSMAASLRPKTSLQPMPPLISIE